MLVGFPLCFGVFQAYYSTLPEFKNSPYIAVVGTIVSGMSYLAAPIMIPLTKRFSKYRYLMIWVGCMLQSNELRAQMQLIKLANEPI
jgi:hypothetical protein